MNKQNLLTGGMKHLDLFSGIGGFALAASWCGFETVGFCEINPWARRVLAKNFPNVPIHDDIKTFKGDTHGPVDILTGGFPCQPYSISGKKFGAKDERDCLPDMLRVVKESGARWVVAENSNRFLDVAFHEVKTFLEDEGYEVGEPLVIPACSVNADHRRNRAWICAHRNTVGLQGGRQEAVQRFARLQEQPARVFESGRSRRSISRPGMLRSYNGIPNGVDRIKGLGNAVVPHVPYRIMRGIIEAEAMEVA